MSADASHAVTPGQEAAHHEPNYMAVFMTLAVFTVLEIAAVKMGLSRAVVITALVGLALTKAILVAAFFMHLKFEKRTLAIIASIPLVLCGFLLFMLMPDAH